MELLAIKTAPKEFRIELLRSLGYDVDADSIYVTKNGEQVIDKYIDKPVRLDNMAIFPGSEIILDDNPLSIASYFEEYGETS